jgi:hypothetical protein
MGVSSWLIDASVFPPSCRTRLASVTTIQSCPRTHLPRDISSTSGRSVSRYRVLWTIGHQRRFRQTQVSLLARLLLIIPSVPRYRPGHSKASAQPPSESALPLPAAIGIRLRRVEHQRRGQGPNPPWCRTSARCNRLDRAFQTANPLGNALLHVIL